MSLESRIEILRCSVDGEHLNTAVHFVPEPEFDAWRQELEGKYRRVVTVDEVSSWVPDGPEVLRWIADPATLWPLLKVWFVERNSLGENSSTVRFLASDSLQARAAQLAGLDIVSGYFLSAIPFCAATTDDFEAEAAEDEESIAQIA